MSLQSNVFTLRSAAVPKHDPTRFPELVLDCVEPASLTLTPHPSEEPTILLKASVRLKPLPSFFPIVMAIACRDAEAIAGP